MEKVGENYCGLLRNMIVITPIVFARTKMFLSNFVSVITTVSVSSTMTVNHKP